ATQWWKAGTLPGHQLATGTLLRELVVAPPGAALQRVAIYARVSSLTEHTSPLDPQAERLADSCAAWGYHVARVVNQSGSGLNDTRPQLLDLAGRARSWRDGRCAQVPADPLGVPLPGPPAPRPEACH